MIQGYAYFVSRPRVKSDLLRPHPIEWEQSYEVVKTIRLTGIDFDNFCTDMLADRLFFESNASLCTNGPVIRCLMITAKRTEDGVLVVPNGAWVDRAAIYREQRA